MDPAGKVAVITGGGSGIGRITALRLAAQGASIMIVDLNDQMGEETVSLIEQKGGRAGFAKAEVTDAEQLSAALQPVLSRFNRFDICTTTQVSPCRRRGSRKSALEVWRRVSKRKVSMTSNMHGF